MRFQFRLAAITEIEGNRPKKNDVFKAIKYFILIIESLLATEHTWCVNYVDVHVFPHGVGGCRLNSDASLALQLHRIHNSTNSILSFHL